MAEYTVTSFSAGELAPRFYGRFDLPQYQKGARKIRNMIVTPEGAAMRRQGTRYVTSAYDSSSEVSLIRMQHTSSDATLIELGNGYMRFFKNGEIVLDGDTFIGERSTKASPVITRATTPIPVAFSGNTNGPRQTKAILQTSTSRRRTNLVPLRCMPPG